MSFDINYFNKLDKTERYKEILEWTKEFYEKEEDKLASIMNSLALFFTVFKEINWCGFYYIKGKELVLGHFQGAPACTRIEIGKGVCGTAAKQKEIIVVDDVHKFPGHIACDARSQSEIVLPVIKNGELKGVFDIDSPIKSRFKEEEVECIKKFLEIIVNNMEF